jgi:predicted ATPase/transcriptional regulator with XRE-family HTH domain
VNGSVRADGVPATLADLLREFRVRLGLTQEALAENAGVSAATIASLEQGLRQRPYPQTLVAISRALSLDASDHATLLARATAGADRRAGRAAYTRSQRAAVTPNLIVHAPTPAISLVGREADVAAVAALLVVPQPAARLITLVGPGGVGKTRLSIAVAAAVAGNFADGVFFVDLAPLRDCNLMPTIISNVVGVHVAGGTDVRQLLFEFIGERSILLVLDNFEQVRDGAPFLTELLNACRRLVMLATSRTALRIRAERRFAVEPLALPAGQRPAFADVVASLAVRLFVERARLVTSDFSLDADNASTVAAICRRLDGMPLAIELAAARLDVLGPKLLLRRLDRQLQLLASGPPDLPERQRTLSKTLAWSYDLLGPGEQTLLRRVSVFAGGWTLSAAEAVCPDADLPSEQVLDALHGLVDSYLINAANVNLDEPRFRMLESVREYASQKLLDHDESEALRARHCGWCLALAEEALGELTGRSQATWLARLDRELADLRLALDWLHERRQTEQGLRLASALGRFWFNRRHVHEGRQWVERFLSAPDADTTPASVQATACYAAGVLASIQGDAAQAVLRLEQSIELHHLAGERIGAVRALNTRAGVSYDLGHLAFASALWEQSLAQARAVGDPGEAAHALGNLGEACFHMGDVDGAERRHHEALALARQAGRADVEAMQLGNLGNVARARGELLRARSLQAQALVMKHELDARRQIAITLADFASIAAVAGDGMRAARLVGAAMALREVLGSPQPVPERIDMERCILEARTSMGPEAWSAGQLAGGELRMEQAIEYALEHRD